MCRLKNFANLQYKVLLYRKTYKTCTWSVIKVNRKSQTAHVQVSVFDAIFSAFFRMDGSVRCTGGATIFAQLRSKIAKSPKIGGKVCAHHFV